MGRTGCVGLGVMTAPSTPLTSMASRFGQARHQGRWQNMGSDGPSDRQTVRCLVIVDSGLTSG